MLQLKLYRISNNEVNKLKLFTDATWNENSKQMNSTTTPANCFNS